MLLRDRTRGHVELGSRGELRLHYDPVPDDLSRLRVGLRETARAFLAAGALEVHLPLHGLPPVTREGDLRALDEASLSPGAFSSLYAVHLFGGAAMADGPDRGVCDVQGACFGVQGLSICDASSLPSNTGVNPQITILANALRIAEGLVAAQA